MLDSMSVVVTECWIPETVVVMQQKQQQQQQQLRIKKRRVTFCAEHPVTVVMEVSHNYPSDYFYTRSDMAR